MLERWKSHPYFDLVALKDIAMGIECFNSMANLDIQIHININIIT